MSEKQRILLIDDDKILCEQWSELFDNIYNFRYYCTSTEFLNDIELGEIDGLIDIVIIDFNLKEDLNGLELLNNIINKSIFSKTLFIALTGFLSDLNESWILEGGFDYFLSKNKGTKSILESIEAILGIKEKILIDRKNKNNVNLIEVLINTINKKSELETKFLKRLISQKLFDYIENDPNQLSPKEEKIAIGFVDICDFTDKTNYHGAKKISYVLNCFFDLCSEIIIRNEGIVDKYIGDQVMWFHNSKDFDFSTKCRQCIQTAIEINHSFQRVNLHLSEKFGEVENFKLSTGLAVGKSIVGLLGGDYRMQYTAIGRYVNLAARLCSKAQQNQILIHKPLADKVNNFKFGKHINVKLKGYRNPIIALPLLKNNLNNIEA